MGENIVVIDVSPLTTMTEYIVLVTTTSLAHSNALTEVVLDRFQEENKKDLLYNRRPKLNNEWILIDAGYFVLNIFLKESREFYALDKLYFKGKIVYTNKI